MYIQLCIIKIRDGLNVANIGGRILAFGGEFRGGPVTVIEEFDGSR